MIWNHRVIEHEANGEKWRSIHEVYYDDTGVPWAYTENPTPVQWSEGDNPTWILDQMHKALDAPVLRETDFVGRALGAEDGEDE
ncbi:hypothetical protein QZM15_16320 [Burkholderia sp. AU44665]|uniref:hypothetical protein n=1 Tax=Burkholderia sp. AU44665 TaxID=3059203 RepID=UPI00265EA0AD|nr:hypothetical protein [Burkholderia sp. AU44665]MDN7700036.1 hypothetical protein [Burkholderia sp. AU44665]